MLIYYAVGFLAQLFFSARILVQWILSERAKTVVSPLIYWLLSIAGSYLLFLYGWLRDDFAIILGQVISYYIYLWNISEKGFSEKIPKLVRILLKCVPLIAVLLVIENVDKFVEDFFRNEKIPFSLLVYGSMGQIIFTLRFIYQWMYSAKRHESILPIGFWIISLVGSMVIVSYGVFRRDPVLILGQSVGFIAYIRNIMIARKSLRHANNV